MIAPVLHFIYRGGGRNAIPDEVTHVTTDASITVIPASLFEEHPNIVELICHENVKKIREWAFSYCPRLRRVVLPGVEEVEGDAFWESFALTHVECPKLERIGHWAFEGCWDLKNINLPSARIVEDIGFELTNVRFGTNLEKIGRGVFARCHSLERISIPLKNDLFPYNDTFQDCENLTQVILVEKDVLLETVAALFLEDWRHDMIEEIDSINHKLPNAPAGSVRRHEDIGKKTTVLRSWIYSVLSKIIDYKAQHRGLLIEAEASIVQLGLPDEIVRNNVLPFLELPSHVFHGEDITVVIKPKTKKIDKIDKGGIKDEWVILCFIITVVQTCFTIALAVMPLIAKALVVPNLRVNQNTYQLEAPIFGIYYSLEAFYFSYFFAVMVALYSIRKPLTFGLLFLLQPLLQQAGIKVNVSKMVRFCPFLE